VNASIGGLNDRDVDSQAQTDFSTVTRYYLRSDLRDAQEQFAAFASFLRTDHVEVVGNCKRSCLGPQARWNHFRRRNWSAKRTASLSAQCWRRCSSHLSIALGGGTVARDSYLPRAS
jgi:hypothetical protein